MKKFNKVVIALVLPLTLLGSYAAKADSLPGEQFVISNPPTNDRYTGINLADSQDSRETYSSLQAFTANGTSYQSSILSRTTCKKVGDPGCEATKFFQYNAQLGMCDSTVTSDCVSTVFAVDASGKQFTGKFLQNFPGDTPYTYPADPSIDLPPGASTFLVDFPELPHAGGTKYLVVAFLQGARGFNEAKFHLDNFNLGIFAVSLINGQYTVTRPADNTDIRPDHTLAGRQASQGGYRIGPGGGITSCAQTSPTQCALPWRMPLDATFGMTLKLHEKVLGWLHGRLLDAQSDISTAPDGDQILTIQGKPSIVPGIYGWFKKSDYPPTLKAYYGTQNQTSVDTNGLGWPSLDPSVHNGPDGLPYSIMKKNIGYNTESFQEVLAWIGALGDKSAYDQSIWSARSIQGGQFGNCINNTDNLSGIVSTNSTMYVGSPPSFNKADQTLDYQVVSPHYLNDGSEFKGSYDLVIRSDVARCIYGFTSAPISATISVVSANGTEQVATTVFNEHDGWIHLAARNFTFSSPTVKVALQQAAAPKPAPATQPPAPTKAVKQVSITCVKGKVTKKIAGVTPICPAGYKKK